MDSALYDFFRDQGSIVAGLLALVAGVLAFKGAMRAAEKQVAAVNTQTEALRRQNSDLKTESRRRLAREAITAIKLLGSVLRIVRGDVAKVKKLVEQPQYFGPNRVAPASARQIIYQLPWTSYGAISASAAQRSSTITCCWTRNWTNSPKHRYIRLMLFKMNCRSLPTSWIF
jgi:hypothetical protein